jgi:predicted nucleic acid-binding protein
MLSEKTDMIQAYAIDTSVLVRLATGHPSKKADEVLKRLQTLKKSGVNLFVSSMVIGEAYIAIQHHYGIPKKEVRKGLLFVIEKGVVSPLDGKEVVDLLKSTSGPGLFDRLIALQGEKSGLKTLTLDLKMASLPNCQKLV